MSIFLWIAGVLFALMAIPAVFYFILYALRGDDLLRRRAVMFYRWAALILLMTFNVAIWGNIVISLLQIWGFIN